MEPLFDKISRGMQARHVPPSRFFASMTFAISLIILSSIAVFSDDDLDATDEGRAPSPHSVFEIITMDTVKIIFVVVAWPLLIAAWVGASGLLIPLLIVTGVFWACVVEWVLANRRRGQTASHAG